MLTNTQTPTDRAAFDREIGAILSEHATLRHLAAAAAKRPGFSTDDAMSLADAMTTHESAEARLFALPFLTHPPKSVIDTAALARKRCLDYTSGNFRHPDPSVAAAQFVDALLAHLTVEEAWLADEKERHHKRLLMSI